MTDGADGLAIRKEKDDMRIAIRKTEKGFTLVELMIVVAIIGILAVLAIYGVSKYITNAKTAEARNAIGQIAKSAVGSFEEERADPALIAPGSSSATNQHQVCASASPVPDTLTKVQNKKYQASQAAGVDYGTGDKNTGWKCLKFALTEPQYFQYGYGADSSNNWTAAAHGDLKGAGAVAQGFAIGGKVVSGQMTVTPQIKESEGAPGDPGSGVTVSMP